MRRTKVFAGALPVIISALISFFALESVQAAPRAKSEGVRTVRGVVLKISDGDTINMRPNGADPKDEPYRIRMLSEDTAELHLPTPGGVASQGYWGEEGRNELMDIVRVGDKIEVEDYGRDQYGRVLGKVYLGDLDVNLEMIRSGWGALYEICDEVSCDLDAEYRRACREAVENGRGLFDFENPVPELPFVFRARKQDRPLSKFVGNFRTKKYYEPTEYERVNICDRVFFFTEHDAEIAGFSPATN